MLYLQLGLGDHLISGGQQGTPLQHLTQNGLVGALPSDLYIPSQKDQNLVDFYHHCLPFHQLFVQLFPSNPLSQPNLAAY
jgi:hypothetical protein